MQDYTRVQNRNGKENKLIVEENRVLNIQTSENWEINCSNFKIAHVWFNIKNHLL